MLTSRAAARAVFLYWMDARSDTRVSDSSTGKIRVVSFSGQQFSHHLAGERVTLEGHAGGIVQPAS
jgi:hypothetical protein